MHVDFLPVTFGSTDYGRDHDQCIFGDEVSYASFGFRSLVWRVRVKVEFERCREGDGEDENKEER